MSKSNMARVPAGCFRYWYHWSVPRCLQEKTHQSFTSSLPVSRLQGPSGFQGASLVWNWFGCKDVLTGAPPLLSRDDFNLVRLDCLGRRPNYKYHRLVIASIVVMVNSFDLKLHRAAKTDWKRQFWPVKAISKPGNEHWLKGQFWPVKVMPKAGNKHWLKGQFWPVKVIQKDGN